MQNHVVYPAVFTYGEKEIAVEFPDLGVATSGIDDMDAYKSAVELLTVVLRGLIADSEAVPTPSDATNISLDKNQRIALFSPLLMGTEEENKNALTLSYEFEIFKDDDFYCAISYDFGGGTQGTTFDELCEMVSDWLSIQIDIAAENKKPLPASAFNNRPEYGGHNVVFVYEIAKSQEANK